MKIEVKERGTKDFYDEFLYVVSRYKKIKKNPKRKVYKITSYLTTYACLVLIFIILFILSYFLYYDITFIFLSGMLTLLFIYSIFYLMVMIKQIKYFMSSPGTKIIDINDKYVEYIDDDKAMKIKWEDIHSITVNKYSIVFVPKDKSNIIISISVDYKDKVIIGLEKYKKESLLIDNSRYYKIKKGR